MSELEELKRLGARPQPNSGRGKNNKGDGVLDGKWIVDVKEYAKSFSLSLGSWGKVCTDAAKSNKNPLLKVVLGTEGQPRVRLIVLTEEEFLDLKGSADAWDALEWQHNEE